MRWQLKADIQPPENDVCFTPRSGHSEAHAGLPLLTHNGSRGSPIRDTLYQRLQPFRHLHDCFGCFRLERWPGGTRTHWKSAALPRRTPEADIREMRFAALWCTNNQGFAYPWYRSRMGTATFSGHHGACCPCDCTRHRCGAASLSPMWNRSCAAILCPPATDWGEGRGQSSEATAGTLASISRIFSMPSFISDRMNSARLARPPARRWGNSLLHAPILTLSAQRTPPMKV